MGEMVEVDEEDTSDDVEDDSDIVRNLVFVTDIVAPEPTVIRGEERTRSVSPFTDCSASFASSLSASSSSSSSSSSAISSSPFRPNLQLSSDAPPSKLKRVGSVSPSLNHTLTLKREGEREEGEEIMKACVDSWLREEKTHLSRERDLREMG